MIRLKRNFFQKAVQSQMKNILCLDSIKDGFVPCFLLHVSSALKDYYSFEMQTFSFW